ncbi:MAG TPA: HmuY family protein [Gemmatimonadaceae bacterium]|nr:HmuY family protein [Gemmatimonadaceae bacterium]
MTVASAAPVRHTRPPFVVLLLLGAFVLGMAYVVGTSLVPHPVPTFTLAEHRNSDQRQPVGVDRPASVTDTLTVEAGDQDRWRFIDLDRGVVLVPPDTVGWDLAARRYHLLPRGDAADLGPRPFDAVEEAPTDGYLPHDGRTDAGHPAMRRWYRYGMFSHLLESKQHVYVLRTSGDSYVKVEVLSYYCPGPRPGCVTVRWAHLPPPR